MTSISVQGKVLLQEIYIAKFNEERKIAERKIQG